jgi:hypothetical protein
MRAFFPCVGRIESTISRMTARELRNLASAWFAELREAGV